MHWTILAVLGLLLIISVYTDLRSGKILNKITFPCMLLGLGLNAYFAGLPGFLGSVYGIGLVFVLYMLFAPASGIGGGDTKLLMAVEALVGINIAVYSILFSAVIGGILAVMVLLTRRSLLATTGNMINNIYIKTILRAPVDISTGSSQIKFRYSPAIALGTLLSVLMHYGLFSI